MKHLLNTLYVTTQGAYLAKDGETVLVRVEQENRMRVPVHTLASVVCFGQVSCSPALMALCSERGVSVSFLTEHGRFQARVEGPVSGNVLLRREQYRRSDQPEATAAIARAMITGKVANCRSVLLRALRERPEQAALLQPVVDRLAWTLRELESATDVDRVRGIEGDAARLYFACFDALLLIDGEEFRFHDRSRRPPLDNVNALLSFVYTLLVHDYRSALECVGLDPAVGFLHRDRPGRPSLALDLMEEMRPILGDRLVLSLINRKQVTGSGFRRTESGAVLMSDDTRKQVLIAYQQRKQEMFQHPFLEEKIPLGMIPFTQALLLARHLRGDLDGYPPLFWR